MVDLTMPFLHMNGTGKAELIGQYSEAHKALNVALSKLYAAGPNGRDYYPRGDDAFRQAQTEHAARVRKLAEVLSEVEAVWLNLNEQTGGR